MANTVDYSLQLSDIGAPQAGAQGELLLAAGATEGAAAATRGKAAAMQKDADTGAISFLGTSAIAAGKGYLESELGKEIQGDLNKLEDVGPQALQSQNTLAYLNSPQYIEEATNQLTVAQENGADPKVVGEFTAELKRIVAAQEQGIMTNTEVRNRIGAEVKKYSAMMPGWATDFRKLAADMTGIERVDTYGIHQALIGKSARDKAAERQQEVQLQLDKEIASEQGVPITGVTPAMRQRHFESQQLKFGLAQMKAKMEGKNLVKEQADEAYGQMVDVSVSTAMLSLSQKLDTVTKLHGDKDKANEASQAGLELSAHVVMLGQQLEQEIRGYTNPAKMKPGTTPMSVAEAEKRITSVRATVKEFQEGIKTIEGRNMLHSMVKNAEGNLSLLMSNYKVANFQIHGLNTLGVLPSGLAQAFVTLPKAEFEKRFGKDLTDSFTKVMTNPQTHANVMINAALGRPVDLPGVAAYDPDLAKSAAKDFVTNINQWAADPTPPTKERLTAFSNTFAGFYSNPANFNPAVPRNLDAVYETLKHPATQKMFSQLDGTQRANALGPLLAGTESAITQTGASVQASITQWNDPSTNAAARAGWRVSLQQNPLSGAFEIVTRKEEQAQGIQEGSAGLPNGLVHRTPAFGGTSAPTMVDRNAAAELARAQAQVGTLNKQLETYTHGTRALLNDGKVDITMVRNAAYQNIAQGNAAPLVQGVRDALGVTDALKNKAEPVVLDEPKVLAAIVAAEKSHTHDNFKESPKGARGPYQFMPETAARFGLKVDKVAGIDERTDPVKAGPAALKYIKILHTEFEGDMSKVAAAYNAGEGNVRKAVEKAKTLGIPNDWRAFLPKPEETVPYIQRFLQKYDLKSQ